MNRVVITGLGIVSSIGHNLETVKESLYHGKSGIRFNPEQAEMGFRSHVAGLMDVDINIIPKKMLRFMGDAAAYSWLAAEQAINDAGLSEAQTKSSRTGLVVGSGGSSTANIVETADIARTKGIKRVGPYRVPRTMGSTASACLATFIGIKGVNYSMSSACATGAHCIGHACELIQLGKQDVMIAGAGEELNWSQSAMFDAMGALSSSYNDAPDTASRAYDAARDGFVISGGAGIVVLESLAHAEARGATIYGEVIGYAATSDGYDMVQPSGEGAARCMQMAIDQCPKGTTIDYINAHGTSTPVGDTKELEAIRAVFGDNIPPISSTKSLTGHALGAAGSNELIYSVLMLKHGFRAASANISDLDTAADGFPILREREEGAMRTVMSNGFGFGGTNAVLIVQAR